MKILEEKKIRVLPLKKQMKVIQKYLNPRFKAYNRHTTFEGLFTEGDFTVHTAAAYLVLVMNHFGLPFEYFQEGNVSYCAYVNGEIFIPLSPVSITPQLEITTLDAKAEFSHFLTSFGLRTNQGGGLNLMDQDETDYYDLSLVKDMKAIAANLLVETAFNYLEIKDFTSFFTMHREAYKMNKNFKNMFWAWNTFKNFDLPKRADLTVEDMELMARLINQTKEGHENDEVIVVYSFWFEKYTGLKMNDSIQDATYKYLMKRITHIESSNQIKLGYNINRADRAIRAANHEDVVFHLGKCLEVEPENKNYKQLLVDHYMRHMDEVDPQTVEEVMDSFDNFEKLYPFAIESERYTGMRIVVYLINISTCYEGGEASKGREAIAMFEEYTKANPHLDIPEEALGNAFTTASRYYSRRQQKTKARELVTKGLSFDPDNEILTERMKFLKKYQ